MTIGQLPTGANPVLDLLQCGSLILADACPPDPRMYLCCMQEDPDGDDCARCWQAYMLYVANGCDRDPYRRDRLREIQ